MKSSVKGIVLVSLASFMLMMLLIPVAFEITINNIYLVFASGMIAALLIVGLVLLLRKENN